MGTQVQLAAMSSQLFPLHEGKGFLKNLSDAAAVATAYTLTKSIFTTGAGVEMRSLKIGARCLLSSVSCCRDAFFSYRCHANFHVGTCRDGSASRSNEGVDAHQ